MATVPNSACGLFLGKSGLRLRAWGQRPVRTSLPEHMLVGMRKRRWIQGRLEVKSEGLSDFMGGRREVGE